MGINVKTLKPVNTYNGIYNKILQSDWFFARLFVT